LQKKRFIVLLIFAAFAACIASATIYELAQPRPYNVFDETRMETPGLRWVGDTVVMPVYPFKVEGALFFAGEKVPLDDPDVAERLDRELQINIYHHANTLLDMKLANRYFPDIEKILTEEGVPTDFKYLPMIESDFRDAYSAAGASGFWQFVPATARTYGLEVNEKVDERYNIEKSTRAACKYLKAAKDRLGSWTAAAASYNFGIDGVASKLQSQHTTNYYDLSITIETSRYVFRMLAMKVIFADPEKAGYHLSAGDLYQPFPYKTIEVDTTVTDLANFAEQFGLKYKELKLLNSWMRNSMLPNSARKVYQVKIMQKS
jgi:membrane-bound lytic murein transglycosylase D